VEFKHNKSLTFEGKIKKLVDQREKVSKKFMVFPQVGLFD
jgi:hypothetical protein